MGSEFRFFNIAPYSPGKEEQVARDMIEYQQLTGNDIVLYCLSFDPEGFPARKKSMALVESYRKLKAALAGSPVRLGVLLQSVLGHWPRDFRNAEKWTRTVNLNGEPVRFCPFDPGFQAYTKEYITLLAREKPVFILGDDDIRSFSPVSECYCPLHTAEFNRRAGTDFTPEQFREAVRESKVGDRIYTLFDQLRRDTVNGVAKLIRETIDAVDPDIPAGTCMPGWEKQFNGETSRCIAGKHPAVMRMANANYLERSPKDFPQVMIRTMAMRAAWADIPAVLDESDTFPHNLYSRAATSFHAKLCGSIMSGLNGAKIWYVNAHRGDYPVSRNYTKILAKNRRFYPALAWAAAESELAGVIIPGHRRFLKWHPVKTGEFFVEPKNWAEVIFGAYGIPFRCSFDLTEKDAVYALAGAETIRRFSDEELRSILSCRVLADSAAALELSRRGFSGLTGVTAEDKPFTFAREKDLKTGRTCRISKKNVPLMTADPAAEMVTGLFRSDVADGSGGNTEQLVSAGTVFFRNKLGGTVCTCAFHMEMSEWDLHGEARKAWLLGILDRLSGGFFPGIVLNEQNVTAIERRQGDDLLAAVFNLCFDPMESIRIRAAAGPAQVELLGSDGNWSPAQWSFAGNELTVETVLPCYGEAVLRIRG
ncbi:MAG: hypothetical protein IJS14_07540 [Lentisphaeria bacterium]|nr:hypothetical protein [Lentisphaeria bacterium]